MLKYKLMGEVVSDNVRETCKCLHQGLLTVTQAVMLLLAEDVVLVQFDGKSFTVSCHSDWEAFGAIPTEDLTWDTPTPEQFKFEV